MRLQYKDTNQMQGNNVKNFFESYNESVALAADNKKRFAALQQGYKDDTTISAFLRELITLIDVHLNTTTLHTPKGYINKQFYISALLEAAENPSSLITDLSIKKTGLFKSAFYTSKNQTQSLQAAQAIFLLGCILILSGLIALASGANSDIVGGLMAASDVPFNVAALLAGGSYIKRRYDTGTLPKFPEEQTTIQTIPNKA